MDNELGRGDIEREVKENLPAQLSYTKIFEIYFPYYLSLGMTEHQFYDENADLVKAFRQAEEYRMKKQNFYYWLAGRYVYEALGAISPIYNPFAKRGTKAKPYMERPLPLTEKDAEEEAELRKKESFEKNKQFMIQFMKKANKRYEGE